jgi:hypothetical protein
MGCCLKPRQIQLFMPSGMLEKNPQGSVSHGQGQPCETGSAMVPFLDTADRLRVSIGTLSLSYNPKCICHKSKRPIQYFLTVWVLVYSHLQESAELPFCVLDVALGPQGCYHYCSAFMLSESPPPDEIPIDFETRVIAQFTFYTTAKDKRGKVKETKTQKVKELDFTFTADNYVNFLGLLLAKHSQDKYKVTERRPYSFKYLHPPSKVYVSLIHLLVKADFSLGQPMQLTWMQSRIGKICTKI